MTKHIMSTIKNSSKYHCPVKES